MNIEIAVEILKEIRCQLDLKTSNYQDKISAINRIITYINKNEEVINVLNNYIADLLKKDRNELERRC